MLASPTTLMTAFMLPPVNMMAPPAPARAFQGSAGSALLPAVNYIGGLQPPHPNLQYPPQGATSNRSFASTQQLPVQSPTSLPEMANAALATQARVRNGKLLKPAKSGQDPNAETIDHFRAFRLGAIGGALLGAGNQLFLGGASPWGVIKEGFGFSPKGSEVVVNQHWGQDGHLYRYVSDPKQAAGLPTQVLRTPKTGFFNEIFRNFRVHAKIDYHDLDNHLSPLERINPFSKTEAARPSQHYTIRLFEDNGVTLQKIIAVSPHQTQVESFPLGERLRQTYQKLSNHQGHILVQTEKMVNDQWQVVEKLQPILRRGKWMAQEVLEHDNPLMRLGGVKLGGIKPATILDHLCHVTPRIPSGTKTMFLPAIGNRIFQRLLSVRGIWMGAAVGAIAVWFAEACNATNTTARFNVTQFPSGLLSGGAAST
ncbi:MAG: hypothetical protein VKK59_01215 [Vampirovibrionales bacterium]|nr:hypothetical protein [Vampirovibrionales bacterium]